MPQVTLYIRVGDLDRWKSIGNKSEFISNSIAALGKGTALGSSTVSAESTARANSDALRPIAEQLDEVFLEKQGTKLDNAIRGLCKEHNVPKGVCKMMKHGVK